MPSINQRLNSYRSTFKPYFTQMSKMEKNGIHMDEKQRVCFSWAVMHKVEERANQEDIDEGRASYLGEALKFNKEEQLTAPRLTFKSGRNYCNWRETQSEICRMGLRDTPKGRVPPEDIDDVPDWMLDLEAQNKRFA